ncbi:uncharacterized protein ARMOST_00139 [Armillaria ostoyae]|uniref:Uncharacterized protein n=1 Tax=Armillaria ostoyae TaxID=47428 RepID=A0A284QKA8_ARMOS|nr:uncharacterized protein ARMOST_00139 [Armillaria ostoyae]
MFFAYLWLEYASLLFTVQQSNKDSEIRVRTTLSQARFFLLIYNEFVPIFRVWFCILIPPKVVRITGMDRIVMAVIFLFSISYVFGAPIHPKDNRDFSGDQRTVLNIVWSCLATIFACTWLAVHPNVPGCKISKGWRSLTLEGAKIMGIAILAPEVIVGWAAEQFIVAWKLCHKTEISTSPVIRARRENSNEDFPDLTMVHGFFLSMGGLYYTRKKEIASQALDTYDPTPIALPSLSRPSSVHADLSSCTISSSTLLASDHTPGSETINVPGTLVTLEALESEPNLVKNLAAISAETIQDKSKGDTLSKSVSILQMSWFIVQCIARAIQHLPIMLLEMTALAFAGLSIITYCLWWYKPLNVKYHISLDGTDSRPTPETHSPEEFASPVRNPSWAKRLLSAWLWIGPITLRDSVDGYYEDIGDGAL